MEISNAKNKLKNCIFSFGGTIFPKAINLVSIPILVRLMSTGVYGRANVFSTYVSILAIVLGMDFAAAVGKGTLEFKHERREFLAVGAFSTFVFTCVVLVIINLLQGFFCNLFNYSPLQLNFLILYAYATFLVSYKSMDLIYNLEYVKNFGLNAIVSTLSLAVSVFCMVTWFSDDRFLGRVVGTAAPAILISGIVFVEIMAKGKKIYDKKYFRFFCRMGIPLIPHSLSQFILANADKIMIEKMISASKSGIYSFVSTFGLVMTAITEAINNLWNPWMFRKLDAKRDEQVKKMFVPYILAFSSISVLIEGVSPEIIKILGTRDYYEGLNYCVWMTLTAYLLFLCNKYVDIQYYEKKTYFVSIGTVLAAVVNIVLNVLFLKKVGYEFAVVSTLISYTVLIIFYMFLVDYVMKRSLINCFFVCVNIVYMYIVAGLIQCFQDKLFIRYIITIIFTLLLAGIAFFRLRSILEREYIDGKNAIE